MTRKRVFVVCRANVNRSFIVEQLLKERIAQEGLPIDVRSGGVMVVEGLRNMTLTQVINEFVKGLQLAGLQFIVPRIGQHQSHAWTMEDVQGADLVVTMTKRQRDHLRQYAPATTCVIMLSQLGDTEREEDVFDAMMEPVVSVEAFGRQNMQILQYMDMESIKKYLRVTK